MNSLVALARKILGRNKKQGAPIHAAIFIPSWLAWWDGPDTEKITSEILEHLTVGEIDASAIKTGHLNATNVSNF